MCSLRHIISFTANCRKIHTSLESHSFYLGRMSSANWVNHYWHTNHLLLTILQIQNKVMCKMNLKVNRNWWWLVAGLLIIGLVACQQQRDTYKDLQNLMQESVQPDGPGVALYVNGPGFGEQLFTRGLANRERGTAVRTISHYRLAGLTKTFISTLVLQMITEGKLTMDDTIAEQLPEFAKRVPWFL